MGLLQGLEQAIAGEALQGRIIGQVEHGAFVTLDGCIQIEAKIRPGGVSRVVVSANRLYTGVAYESEEQPVFEELHFSVEGLDEWLGLSGFNLNWDRNGPDFTLKYAQPDEIQLQLRNDLRLVIGFGLDGLRLPIGQEVRFVQKAQLKLVSSSPRAIDELLHIAHRINTFLCFAVNETVTLEEVNGVVSSQPGIEVGGSAPRHQIKICYRSRPEPTRFSKPLYRQEMLFRYEEIYIRLEEMLQEWLSLYEKFDPALSLYFSAVSPDLQNVGARFIMLVHALEALHRRTSTEGTLPQEEFEDLRRRIASVCSSKEAKFVAEKMHYANEPSLSARIKALMLPFKDLFGTSKERTKFVRRVVDTRNYMTHHDDSLADRACRNRDLVAVTYQSQLLFQLHLLALIHIPAPELLEIFQRNRKMQQMIRFA